MVGEPWYASREDVKAELDVKETARADRRIDRALESSSRQVEGFLHRILYPRIATKHFDWPNAQRARPWRLWLDDNELISATTVTAGGVEISASDYFLEPNTSGPPYNRLEIDLASSAAFGGGDTHQRDISILGLWGYRDDETTVGALTEDLDGSEAAVGVDAATSAEVGVGNLLRINDERMIVTGRRMADTTVDLGVDLGAQQKDETVAVADGTQFALYETILIDSERMHIVDIAGENLTVKRGWDGTTLAAHTAGADIYAPRTLTVERGAAGSTAATHTAGTGVGRWDSPGPVRELVLAEALNILKQGETGWARTQRGSSSAGREVEQKALDRLRDQVYVSHGRKARIRGV